MSYINAFEVLPIELIEEIQKYIEGDIMYIPKKKDSKKSWGDNTSTKHVLGIRNDKIYRDYQSGMTCKQLSEKYFLVEKSIRRIIRQECKKDL